MSRGPATKRFDAVSLARESERLLKCPTVSMSKAVIDALLEADADRAQSETLAIAVAASESVQDPCEACGRANAGEPDPSGEFEWVCEGCWHERNDAFGVPSAWDAAFDKAHADREDR